MIAESGGSSPIRMRTMRAASSIAGLGKTILQQYEASKATYKQSLEKFVSSSYYLRVKVYEFDLDSPLPGRRITGVKIWKLMRAEPELVPDIAKAVLEKSN